MKSLTTILIILGIGAVGGTVFYLNHQNPAPIRSTVEEAPGVPDRATGNEPPPPVNTIATEPKQSKPEIAIANDAKPVSIELSAKPAASTNSIAHTAAGDTLVSAQTGYRDRQALLKKLKKEGGLDAAIAELKQRAAENPDDATIQTALGEAIMNKFPIEDYNEAATLGVQINQSFDAALKVDPANWEAQYSKAAALSGWPSGMTGPEVIQRLSSLIDQQDTMSSQPEFAQTYLLLGKQYKKAGQLDYAKQTWVLGSQKFPNDAALQEKVTDPNP